MCKYFPCECIGVHYLCPFADMYKCAIKPVYLDVEKDIEEYKAAVKEAA